MDLYHLIRAADEHGHSDHTEEGGFCETASCLRNWKIAFAAILFVEGVIFGYVVIALRRFACLSTKKFRTLLSYVNVGGGGIFLATGLLHIIPEALEFMNGGHSEEEGAHGDHDVHSLTLASDAAGASTGGDAHGPEDHAEGGHGGHEGHEEGGHGFPLGFTLILLTFLVFLFFDRILFTHHNHGHSEAKTVAEEETNDEEEPLDENVEPASEKLNGFKTSAFLTATAVTVGIGAHSVLEGVVMGAASWSTALNSFIAISAHRWATSMALGSRFATANLSFLPYTALVFAFAAVAPIGVAIGFSVKHLGDTFLGVIFAISGGIFLYVGGFEVPSEEFVVDKSHRYGKFLTYTIGAGIMVAITGILIAADVSHAH